MKKYTGDRDPRFNGSSVVIRTPSSFIELTTTHKRINTINPLEIMKL